MSTNDNKPTLIEMVLYLESIGYHPEDLAAYSEEEIIESYNKETNKQ